MDLYRALNKREKPLVKDGQNPKKIKQAQRVSNFEEAAEKKSGNEIIISRYTLGANLGDVTTVKSDGTEWVIGQNTQGSKIGIEITIEKFEGVSVTGWNGIKETHWSANYYFLIPEGTDIPASLDILHTPVPGNEFHHSIRCLNDMRKDAFEGALDTLARNAIQEACRQGRASLLTDASQKSLPPDRDSDSESADHLRN